MKAEVSKSRETDIPVSKSRESHISLSQNIHRAVEGVIKEMEMALRVKTNAEVALNVLKDRMHRMEKHQMATRKQVEFYLKLAKDQIAHFTTPPFKKIKELKEYVREQKEHLDCKDEIIIHKDNIWVQQKKYIDELTRELKQTV